MTYTDNRAVINGKKGADAGIDARAYFKTGKSDMLRNDVEFNDLGPDYFDRMNTAKLKRYHLRRLAELGCDVSNLIPAA